jgi:Golgi phosphoprotein 3
MTTSTPDDLLLAEELLLLALDDDKGTTTISSAETGLAGALLLDLAVARWLRADGDKLVPADEPPTAEPPPAGLLGDALAVIRDAGEPHGAKHWVRRLPRELKPLRGRVAQRLVERGVLADERRKVLGLVSIQRYPEADPEPERALRERLRSELTGGGDVSPRTALLVPLLSAYRLVGGIVGKADRKPAEARAKAIAEQPGDVGGAVRAVLNETQAAVMAAVTAATTSAAVSGSC